MNHGDDIRWVCLKIVYLPQGIAQFQKPWDLLVDPIAFSVLPPLRRTGRHQLELLVRSQAKESHVLAQECS